jgi:phosphate transport system substrate-binding protein
MKKHNSAVKGWVLIAVIAINLYTKGCAPQKEETTTIGEMTIVSDESIAPLLNIQIKEFMRIWNGAAFQNQPELTRRAVDRFINQETRFIVLSRPLKPDEVEAIRAAKLEIVSKPIAYDAVCFITNPKNPVKSLTLEQLREILKGKITNWSQVGGSAQPIQVLITSRNDGQRDFVQDSVLRSDNFAKSAYPCSTTAQMKDLVLKYDGAIGYSGMAHLRDFLNPEKRDTSKYKVLSLIAENDSLAVLPMQEPVYKHRYPLVYTVYYVYLKSDKLPLGFAAFLSKEGQKVFQRNGSAPFEPPVWIVNFKED